MEILQERVTLDEAALAAIETFPNGCSYNLFFRNNGEVFVSLGCYGVHPNLTQGKDRLFMNWFYGDNSMGNEKLINLLHETIFELKKRKPCTRCGGFLHQIKD